MASTPEIIPIAKFDPIAEWDTLERRYEAAAVTATVRRAEERRARRRAVWRMVAPALIYVMVAAALILSIIIVLALEDFAADPVEQPGIVTTDSTPATTSTGTTTP